MRMLTKLLGTALVLLGTTALAGPNDLVLEGLGDPKDASTHGSFRVLTRELGAALSATNLMPAETLGHSAFAAAMELSVLSLDTRSGRGGFCFPTTHGDNACAQGIVGPLLMPSVHVRKGLPFSFELGGRVGWVDKSRMFTATAELKWAVIEGFAYLPDVAVRGYATRLFNARDLSLTTGGVDFGVSKQFAIGGMATLTPYGGWNPGFTGATSGRMFFPMTDAQLQDAGVQPGTPEALLAQTGAYRAVRFLENMHQRFYGGLRFISGAVQLGAEVTFTAIPGFDDAGLPQSPPPLLGFNTMLGLDF